METQNENQPKKKKKLFSKPFLLFISCFVFSFFIVWILLDYWQDTQGGDTNFVHESVGLIFSVLGIIGSYLVIYDDAEAKKRKKIAEMEALQKAQNEKAKRFFADAIEQLRNPQIETQEKGIQQLLKIALEAPDYRQACLDGLAKLNTWVVENKEAVLEENLVTWRLKKVPLETVKVPVEQQQITLKSIGAIEKIIKKHCEDVEAGTTKHTLNFNAKCAPALNLGFTKFPPKAVNFSSGILWETSFWSATLKETDFSSAELEKTNFWKAQLENVNFENANLTNAKLKTDLKMAKNLTDSQFFSTEEWTCNMLSEAQLDGFFPKKEYTNPRWEQWSLGEIKRRKMFK